MRWSLNCQVPTTRYFLLKYPQGQLQLLLLKFQCTSLSAQSEQATRNNQSICRPPVIYHSLYLNPKRLANQLNFSFFPKNNNYIKLKPITHHHLFLPLYPLPTIQSNHVPYQPYQRCEAHLEPSLSPTTSTLSGLLVHDTT